MSDMRSLLLAAAVELAKEETREGKTLVVSVRCDSVANRTLTVARGMARFESAKTDCDDLYVALKLYKGGMLGPMLIKTPTEGCRCGVWTAELKKAVWDAYLDVRALYIVKNPVPVCEAYGISAYIADYENTEAARRVAERNLVAAE